MEKYDLIVVGAGISGVHAAKKAAENGLSVLLIEQNKVGGTCLNCGCIPSKFLLTEAEEFEKCQKNISMSMFKGQIEADYENIHKKLVQTVSLLNNGMKNTVVQSNVKFIQGTAEIKDSKVKVGDEEYLADNIIIATGSEPFVPAIEGIKDAESEGYLYTNENIFEMTELPETMVVIGGGVSGIELSYAFALLGVNVCVLEAEKRILGAFDADFSDKISSLLKQKGIKINTGVRINEICENLVSYYNSDNELEALNCDIVYVCTGRRPNLNGIPSSINKTTRGFIEVDKDMKTNIPNIYAVGDVTGKGMLAYTGTLDAEKAVNAIMGIKNNASEKIIAKILYLSPECVQIGMVEDELKGKEYHKAELSMNYSGRFIINQKGMSPFAFVKMLFDENDILVGASMMSTNASEISVMFAMMIETKMIASQIAGYVFPHPTECEIIHDCVLNYLYSKL